MESQRGMPRQARTIIVLLVLGVAVVIVLAIGLRPIGVWVTTDYSLATTAYTVTLTPQAPAAFFEAPAFDGPFFIAANTTGGPLRGVLQVAGEVAFRANLTNMSYVYPYATAPSGSLTFSLFLDLLPGADASLVTIQLGSREDRTIKPEMSRNVQPSTAALLHSYGPFDRSLAPAPDGPTAERGNDTVALGPNPDSCWGMLATVLGGFWVNVTAPQNASYGFVFWPDWFIAAQTTFELTGNATLHGHAPADDALNLQLAVCKPTPNVTLLVTVDGA